MMAAVAPAQLGSRLETKDVNMDGSDVDAEGEDDVEIPYQTEMSPIPNVNATMKGDGDQEEDEELDDEPDEEDGEGGDSDTNQSESSETDEEDDAEGEDENDGVVGAVKLPTGMDLEGAADSAENSSSDDENESRDGKESNGSEGSNSSDESVAVEEWEDASAGEGETDMAARNNCVFCKQDEDNDPSQEYEEYLSCSVCGDNAHRQCARDASSLLSESEAKDWRCPQCVSNSLVPEPEDDKISLARRLSTSSSRLTRDLLPATRGAPKPGSHSIFSTLIVEDDPLDGSRALRKRKSSSESREVQSTTSSKRRKKTSNVTQPSVSGSSSVADVDVDVDVDESKDIRETSSQGRDGRATEKSKQNITEAASRPSRPRRQKPEAPRVRPLIRESQRLIIAIKVDLSQIKEKPPKKSRRPTATSSGHARFAASNTMSYSGPFYSLHDREADESKIKPYGGILNETEADTSKTFPTPFDRARFEDARQKAEEEWKIKTAASEAEQETKGRSSQKISGPPSKIKCINFGGYEIDTWYAAPYPEEYSRNRVLYICEFCLKYMPSDYVAWRHKLKCPAKHPPGDEIYRDKSVSIFEVDGRKNPVYCQNLCLLAKLFLGSKTLYYDVEPFLFYIMTEYDDLGYHFVGYFSKEKRPSSMNNVSCILTLPIHQRKGYGNLLIDFSYLLTRVEKKTGSPEKPLSDMGLVSYRNYWRLVLAYTFLEHTEPISINKISDVTGMTADDIIAALEALRALVRDPVSKTYALRVDRAYLKETIEKWERKGYVKLNPDALVWTPYVMGHYNLTNYDRGAISTVAPREDEDEQAPVPEEGVQQQQAAGGPSMKINGTVETIVIPTAGIDTTRDATLAAPLESSSAPDLHPGPSSPPKANGVYTAAPSTPVKPPSPIPPTRYEIYPPIPGTISRRRTNKSGNRRSNYTPGSLSIRRDRTLNGSGSPRANGISPRHITTPTSRKTRSALGKELEEAKAEAAKSAAEEGESSDKGKDNADDHQEQINGEKIDEDRDPHSEDSSSESDSDIDADADGGADPAAEDDDESDDEAEPEPELEHDVSAGEDDADFEPDGDGDVDEDAEGEDEDDDEHDANVDADGDVEVDAEADVDVEVEADDDEDAPEGESEDAVGEEDEDEEGDDDDDEDEEQHGEEDEEDEDNGSEDAEGESDHGDDVAMVDA